MVIGCRRSHRTAEEGARGVGDLVAVYGEYSVSMNHLIFTGNVYGEYEQYEL